MTAFLTYITIIGSLLSSFQLNAAECAFCNQDKISKQKIYETKYFTVLVDYAPIQEGHLLIVAKRNIVHLQDLNDDEAVDYNHIVKKVYSFFKEIIGTEDYIVLEKNGKSAGQTVPHLHIHMIPIKHSGSLMLGQLGVLYKIVFGAKALSQEEVANKVRGYSSFFQADQKKQLR